MLQIPSHPCSSLLLIALPESFLLCWYLPLSLRGKSQVPIIFEGVDGFLYWKEHLGTGSYKSLSWTWMRWSVLTEWEPLAKTKLSSDWDCLSSLVNHKHERQSLPFLCCTPSASFASWESRGGCRWETIFDLSRSQKILETDVFKGKYFPLEVSQLPSDTAYLKYCLN